ncbi:hypothetical protein KJ966_22900 [bacterium]|nr:hypothetical protein [bacterium]
MDRALHPVYEKYLLDCYEMVQEKMGTGELTSEDELEAYVRSICSFPSATDGFSFICQYAPYSWKEIVSIELLEECELDLVEFIKQTVQMVLGVEVMTNLAINSDGYRFLMEGSQTATVCLQQGSPPVEFKECWLSEAEQYKDCQLIETVVVEDGKLVIYQLPDDLGQLYVMNHIDASLIWIGKPVVN